MASIEISPGYLAALLRILLSLQWKLGKNGRFPTWQPARRCSGRFMLSEDENRGLR